MLNIVIDTNVFVSAIRSKRGASFKLFMLVGGGKFDLHISVPLLLEYEDAAKRLLGVITLTEKEIDNILDYISKVAIHRKIFYLWRPWLPDPKDDMVLELAIAAGCDRLVTYNKADFRGVEDFGIQICTPQDILEELGG